MMRKKKEEHLHELRENVRPIYCPQCRRRIMDAVSGTKTQLITPVPGRYPDFIVKCGHCGAEVGVVKTE